MKLNKIVETVECLRVFSGLQQLQALLQIYDCRGNVIIVQSAGHILAIFLSFSNLFGSEGTRVCRLEWWDVRRWCMVRNKSAWVLRLGFLRWVRQVEWKTIIVFRMIRLRSRGRWRRRRLIRGWLYRIRTPTHPWCCRRKRWISTCCNVLQVIFFFRLDRTWLRSFSVLQAIVDVRSLPLRVLPTLNSFLA